MMSTMDPQPPSCGNIASADVPRGPGEPSLAGPDDLNNVTSRTEIGESLAGPEDLNNVPSRTEIGGSLAGPEDLNNVPSRTEICGSLAGTEGLNNVSSRTEIGGSLAGPEDLNNVTSRTEIGESLVGPEGLNNLSSRTEIGGSLAGTEDVNNAPLHDVTEENLAGPGDVNNVSLHDVTGGSLAGSEGVNNAPLQDVTEGSLAGPEDVNNVSLHDVTGGSLVGSEGVNNVPLHGVTEGSLAGSEHVNNVPLYNGNRGSLLGPEELHDVPLLDVTEGSLAGCEVLNNEPLFDVTEGSFKNHGELNKIPSIRITEGSLAGPEDLNNAPLRDVTNGSLVGLKDHEDVNIIPSFRVIVGSLTGSEDLNNAPLCDVTDGSVASLKDHEELNKIPSFRVTGESLEDHEEVVKIHLCMDDESEDPTDFLIQKTTAEAVPLIVLEDARENLQLQLAPVVNGAVCVARKSPVTVQEWVDSLPVAAHRSEDDSEEPPLEDGEDVLDLGLGAEAGLLYDAACPAVTIVRPQAASDIKSKILVREPSVQSDNSHGSSVESYLESRKPDPEEVLMSLGFGGPVSPLDTEVSRIPRRFLQPSKVKGVAIEDFLRYQQDLIETFETGFCGYHGLSGSLDSMPSVIVAKIMEKLREHERDSVTSVTTSEQPSVPAQPAEEMNNKRFSSLARRVLKRTSVLGAIPSRQASNLSVLNADNRRFLESQGNKSPEVPRKRMVIGHRSYTFGCDGEMIEVTKPKPLIHKDSVLSSATSLTSMDSDSDTDEQSDSFELGHRPRLAQGSPPNKRRNWESPRYKSIEEDVELQIEEDAEEKGSDSVFGVEAEPTSRRGSLKRQQHISEEAMDLICGAEEEVTPHLNVVPDLRGDSFEMEEIGALEDEARSAPLSRARSDSSGFLEGESEQTDMKRSQLSLPVVHVHDERGRSCSFHSLGSTSSLQHRSQSLPNTLSVAGSWSSVSNMFSSCSDESVIHVATPPNVDLQDLLRELAGRGLRLSTGPCIQPAGQTSRYEADAVRLALGAYSNQLAGGTSSLDLLDCGPPEARREIQAVREIRGQIAAELRRVAALLEEQPGPRAAAITRQMTILLREQTRLCHQLESLSQDGSTEFPSYTPSCCSSEQLLGAMREENRRLERLVESHSQELAEIRLLLQQLVSRKS